MNLGVTLYCIGIEKGLIPTLDLSDLLTLANLVNIVTIFSR